MTEQQEKKEGILKRALKSTREVIYGMAAHDTARFALKTRGSMEHLFILITMATSFAKHAIFKSMPTVRHRHSAASLGGCPMDAIWGRCVMHTI